MVDAWMEEYIHIKYIMGVYRMTLYREGHKIKSYRTVIALYTLRFIQVLASHHSVGAYTSP